MNKSRNKSRHRIYTIESLPKEMQMNEQQRNVRKMLDSKEDKNYQIVLALGK